jgi:hypothetical protein
MRSYFTIFTISILAGFVGLTAIGCTSSPIATVPPSSKSAPIVAANTPDRAAIGSQAEAAQPIANNTPTEPPKLKAVESSTASITREQAIDRVAKLPEIAAWRAYVTAQSSGTVSTTLSVNAETPETFVDQEYWSVSFHENQPRHRHRWQSFLVRLDGQEILVDGPDGKYRSLDTWRRDDKPMARVNPPKSAASPQTAAPQTALPFVGTKYFNFLNGSGTGQSITIAPDGTTTVKTHGTMNTSISYSGPFTNPILFKDGDGVRLEGDTIYSLRTDGEMAQGCIRADEPCKSTLN